MAVEVEAWAYKPADESNYGDGMAGAIAIVVVLLIFPVAGADRVASISRPCSASFLQRDGEIRNEGSELVELND